MRLFRFRESEWGYNNHIGELKMGFPDEKEETNRATESERTVELTRLKKLQNTVKYDFLERISGKIKWIIHDLTVGRFN